MLMFLVGCNSQPVERLPLPEGVQEMSGYLLPTELSLVRRGTHLLLQDGIERYLVESKLIALQSFEKKKVTVRGILEENTDPTSLPILVVQEIDEHKDPWQQVSVASLGLTMDVPPQWTIERLAEEILLFAPSSTKKAIVRVVQEETTSLPKGTPVRVGGLVGVRVLNEENGQQQMVVLRGHRMISIEFMPQGLDDLFAERMIFLRLLQSLQWNTLSKDSSQSSILPKDYGAPCGGTAGVLCPKGFYCEIADFKEGIGRCVKI